MILSAADRETFANQGVLKLRSAVSKKETEAAKRFILGELERLKLRVKGKLTSGKVGDLPFFQQTTRLGQMIPSGPWLENLFPAALLAAMDSLGSLGLSEGKAKPLPQLLLSFPHKKEWTMGGLNWHLDLTPPKADIVPGVQAFVMIDELIPHGGGTLALAGSHKLHHLPEASKGGLHTLLRQDPVFSQLYQTTATDPAGLLTSRLLHGIPLSVIEMSGSAGDVFLMDMRVLHSPSVNAAKNLRMMATSRLVRMSFA